MGTCSDRAVGSRAWGSGRSAAVGHARLAAVLAAPVLALPTGAIFAAVVPLRPAARTALRRGTPRRTCIYATLHTTPSDRDAMTQPGWQCGIVPACRVKAMALPHHDG